MRILKFSMLLIIFFTFIFSGLAQDTTVTKIDPEKKEDIMRLLKAMGTSDVAKQLLDYTVNRFRNFLPDSNESYWDSIKTRINLEEYLELNVPIFEKYLTHEDIRIMTEFFESPAGKKYIHARSDLLREMFEIEDIWAEKIGRLVYKILEDDGHISRENNLAPPPDK